LPSLRTQPETRLRLPEPNLHALTLVLPARERGQNNEPSRGSRHHRGASITLSRPTRRSFHLLGCGVIRRYGLLTLEPFGKFCLSTSGSCSEGTITQSSPSFQFTGVATEWLSVSCSESITRKISSKLRPVLAG